MTSRPWTEKSKVNYRIEVEGKGYGYLYRQKLTEGQRQECICDDLNEFFKQHKDCPFEAYVNADEIDVCHFCKQPYEEYEDVCANCGKGSKELMLEKLDENKKEAKK